MCTLHDIGNQDGTNFLVMEYLEGVTLAQRLRKGALPLDQALRYAIEITDTLDRAHQRAVVHRDLKPANITLTKAGTRVSGKLTTSAAMEHAITQQTRIEQKYRGLLECAPDAMVIADEQGTIVLVKTEAERLFGYSRDELLGENVEILVPEGLRDRLWERMLSGASDPQTQPMGTGGELYAQRKDSGTFSAEISLGFFNSEDDLLIVSAIRDTTERKKVEDRPVQLATHDSLTGLYNRRHFQEHLRGVLAQALRYDTSGALLLLDLDGFKHVNDHFGHRTGDQLLTNVAVLLQGRLRQTDLAARMGGDEFAIILPHVDEHKASAVAKEIVRRMWQLTVAADEDSLNVTTSIGVALFPKHGVTAEILLAHADIAMCQAKARGRNRFTIYRRRRRSLRYRATAS